MSGSPKRERPPRYRFGPFVFSPARRLLLRDGREILLIPRYIDLLLLLVSRRNEAVHRREILDVVWDDVVVSDGALSQAVRILRRTLGDDPRHPVFIRTVPRHGYRFVYAEVEEEPDDAPMEEPAPEPVEANHDEARVSQAVAVLLQPGDDADEDALHEAAECLHRHGTADALRQIDGRAGHETARAWLRDTRWDVPGAGPVPLFGAPGGMTAARILFGLRLRRTVRLAGSRFASAVAGAGITGVIAGLLGGLLLRFGPDSIADNRVLLALPLVGALIGAVGAVGVGAGLAAAEASIRSHRIPILTLSGAAGGGAIGLIAHGLGSLVLEGLFAGDLRPLAGGFEGLVLGAAVGLGYALATPTSEGGMATPHGPARLAAVAAAAVVAAIAAGLLASGGSYLGAMSLDFMAQSLPGSQVRLDPLARLLGEASPGPLTRLVISSFEGLMFGAGVVFGLTRRPR